MHSLRAHSVVVLGNHDLSLLAIGERTPDEQRKVNPDLQRIVLAGDRDELLTWLATGSPYARVGRVEHREEEPTGESGGFFIEFFP